MRVLTEILFGFDGSGMAIKNKQIYQIVKKIPHGCVATYGQIAQLLGIRNGARQIGYALSALPNPDEVPWHRVVNAKGEISMRSNPDYAVLQRELLREEGIEFDVSKRISLQRYLWRPEH